MIFSKDEIRDIFIAILSMTIVFSFNGNFHSFFYLIPTAFVAVTISFLIHQIAQKMVARRYGAQSFFKLWPFGLVSGLIFMLIPPLKLIVPGGTMIYMNRFARWKRRYLPYSRFTDITVREIGIIAVIGPIINIILALISWSLLQYYFPGNSFLPYMVIVNLWLAVLNLIPVTPIDGAKIFTWKPWFWATLVIISVIFLARAVLTFFG